MDENNKHCACTGTDAMFHIKLNQQGPEGKQGPQGAQGVDGISPSITVESSTQNNYQLKVSTAYNTFVTPNLKGDDKVQIDPWTLTRPGDIPEFGLTKTVTNEDIIDGTVTIPVGLGFSANINDNTSVSHSINPRITFPITTTILDNGVIIGKSTSYLLTNRGITANNPIILTRNTNGTLTFDFDNTVLEGKQDKFATVIDSESTTSLDTNGKALSITASTIAVGNNLVNEINGSNSQLYLKQNDVVAGDNITVNKTATGIVIAGTASQYTLPIASATTLGGIKVGENLTIDEDGILNATGGSGTSIDDSTTSSTSTWSSSKINSEITTVTNEVVQTQSDVASLDADVSTIKPIVESNTTDIENLKDTKNDNVFDIGKFAVVGSPTITDDGIASGFSSGNYLTINNIGSLLQNATNWQIEFPIIFANGTITTRQEIFGGTQNSAPFSLLVRLWSDGKIMVAVNGITYTDSFSLQSLNTVSANIKYSIRIKVENNVMYFYLNNILQDSHSITEKVKFSDILRLGVSHQTSYYFRGSINLSKFLITIDGNKVFNGLMESTKPIYDKIASTSTALSTLQTDTDNNFSAVNSALNEKANLSDLSNYVPLTTYNALLARVEALETEINGGYA